MMRLKKKSADFAFTKFSMIKKILLVMGHWYNQRLATLIQYFFYKNLVLGNVMLLFQIHTVFSTQSIFDSMYLTFYNLLFTSAPVLLLSVTEQTWPADTLANNPALYKDIRKNKLMSWPYFLAWCVSAIYHSLVVYWFTYLAVKYSIINLDGRPIDLWCFGAAIFHLLTVVVTLKLWLQARYHTLIFVASLVGSILLYIAFNTVYSLIHIQIDGDVLGTYIRLLSAPAFWFLNVAVVIACLVPDYVVRILSEQLGRSRVQLPPAAQDLFTTRL